MKTKQLQILLLLLFLSALLLAQEDEQNLQKPKTDEEVWEGFELLDIEIVGYEIRTKEEIKGAITTVSGEEVSKQISPNVLNSLQGKVSGVNIQAQGGAFAGQNPSVVIRGLSSLSPEATKPLYVIDGVVGASLESINPQDIDYLEVLKDAEATSLYGSRGGAGVILIKTKRGSEKKQNTDLTYTNSLQFLQMNRFHDPVKLAQTYGDIPQFADVSQGLSTWAINQTDPNFRSYYWMDENGKIYKPQDVFQLGFVQQHHLSLASTREKQSFYVGAGILDQTSVIKGENYQKYNLQLSTTQQLKPWAELSIGANGYYSQLDRQYNPFLYVVLTRGSYNEANNVHNYAVNKTMNPFELFKYQENRFEQKGINAYTQLKLEPIKNLYFSTVFSGYYKAEDRKIVKAVDAFDPIYNILSDGEINQRGNNEYSYQIEEIATYFKGFLNNRLTLNILGRFQWNQRFRNYFNYRAGQLGDAEDFNDFANAGRPEQISNYHRERSILQYNGRVGLDWEKKYSLAVGFAADVNSAMPSKNQHAIFPTTALAWNLKNENFLKYNSIISDFKWKAAWGMSANSEAVLDTYYDQLYIQSGAYMGQIGFYTEATKMNPNLQWEVVNSTNTGIEIGFLQRYTVNLEYYYKRTDNAIATVKQGLTVADGFYNTLENIGTLQNQGVELNLRALLIGNKNFSWSMGYLAAYNRNKVLKINNPEKEVNAAGSYGGFFVHQEGKEMGMLRLREGDEESYYRINPNFTGSINTNLAFFNFDISATLVYAAGGNQFVNAYSDEAPKSKKEEFVQSNDYVRLREVTLGYSFPNKWMQKAHIKSLRIFVQGGNLLTWVKGKDIVDPEIATADRAFETNVSNPFMSGFDDGYPANPISFTVGLSLKF